MYKRQTFSDTVWTPFNADDRKQSLKNVTSLSDAELVEYVQSTPLFRFTSEYVSRSILRWITSHLLIAGRLQSWNKG